MCLTTAPEPLCPGLRGWSQEKRPGDQVLSGSINRSAQPLTARVSKVYAESTMALFKQALAAALDKKSVLERSSIRMASDFTPFTLALCAGAFWWQRWGSAAGAGTSVLTLWRRVLAVLMAATPCPAAIGVPIAFLCGISTASRRGISMKSGAALEHLGRATVCVLDKTGTLTYGAPRVRSIDFLGSSALPRDEVLELCASLEQASNHPMAVSHSSLCSDRDTGAALRCYVHGASTGGAVGTRVDAGGGAATPSRGECAGHRTWRGDRGHRRWRVARSHRQFGLRVWGHSVGR
jgi:cation transport ATPase